MVSIFLDGVSDVVEIQRMTSSNNLNFESIGIFYHCLKDEAYGDKITVCYCKMA